MSEEIGKHKGAVETLMHEKKELSRLLQIVNSQLQKHLSALEEAGIDTDDFIQEMQEGQQQQGRQQRSGNKRNSGQSSRSNRRSGNSRKRNRDNQGSSRNRNRGSRNSRDNSDDDDEVDLGGHLE